MEDLQNQLGAIMSDPAMMEKLMAMAQSLGGSQQQQPPEKPDLPPFDPAMLQRLTGIMGQSGIDPHQKGLLSALRPYLSCHRIDKLEKAMRAAKMAKLASVFLGGDRFV